MSQVSIVLIAAIGLNRELGYNNELLWHLPGDLPRFKQLTSGHTIVMGRKTFDSIGRPLPNRRNIVISRNSSLSIDGAEVVNSVEQAIELARQDAGNGTSKGTSEESTAKLFVIGGGEIYSLFLPYADTLELTEVNDAPEKVDAFFPEFESSKYQKTVSQEMKDTSPTFAYVSYQRICTASQA